MTITSVDQLISEVKNTYDTLSKQLKVIAQYIENNRNTMVFVKINEIAHACGVQPSAITRFAQRFGFSGFSEMQVLFRADYAPHTAPTNTNYSQRIQRMMATHTDGMKAGDMARAFIEACQNGLEDLHAHVDDEQLEKAVDMLVQANNTHVIGIRRSFAVASYVTYALQHTNKRVHLITGIGGMYREQIRSVRAGDVLVAISFTPYARETLFCVRAAHHNGAKILLITDSQLNPLSRFADVVLTVREGSAFAFRSLTSTFCLCQALFIAFAYRMELTIEETKEFGGYDD